MAEWPGYSVGMPKPKLPKPPALYKHWVHCTHCKRSTQHELLHMEQEAQNEPGMPPEWREFLIVRCRGCTNTTTAEVDFSVLDTDYNSELIPSWRFPKGPSPYAGLDPQRDPIEGSEHFPEAVRSAYEEVVKANNARTRLLCGLGLRTIVEATCIAEGCKKRTLADGINALAGKGFLSKGMADRLHTLRFLGNDAAHDIQAPGRDELNDGIDIIEHVLVDIYVNAKKGQNIEAARARRGKAAPAKTTPPTG